MATTMPLLDEVDLALKDVGGVAVEADDEAALDFEAGALDAFDVGNEVASDVLLFAAFGQRFLAGRFDADEDRFEAGVAHHFHEVGIIGEVDGGFGEEGHAAAGSLPVDEGGEEFPHEVVLVADEVVVDEEDFALPAKLLEVVKFGDDLFGAFDARAVAEEGGDVAEFALKRAATGILDAHGGVLPQFREVPEGHGRGVDVGEFVRAVEGLRDTATEVVEEKRHGDLGFVEDEVGDAGEIFVLGGEEGAAGDDGDAEGVGATDDFAGGVALDGHSAEQDVVGPPDVGVFQPVDVEIDEALGPLLGEQGGDGEEAEGREGDFLADELERVFEAPESVRDFGVDEQDVHEQRELGRAEGAARRELLCRRAMRRFIRSRRLRRSQDRRRCRSCRRCRFRGIVAWRQDGRGGFGDGRPCRRHCGRGRWASCRGASCGRNGRGPWRGFFCGAWRWCGCVWVPPRPELRPVPGHGAMRTIVRDLGLRVVLRSWVGCF